MWLLGLVPLHEISNTSGASPCGWPVTAALRTPNSHEQVTHNSIYHPLWIDMVEQIFSSRVIAFFGETGAKGTLLGTTFAENGGPRSVAVKTGVGAAEEGDDSGCVAYRAVAIVSRYTFRGRRQVHHSRVACQDNIGLIEQGRQFEQRHARLCGK